MIARTGNRLLHRWAVIAGEGDGAYVFRYALTRDWAEYHALEHPENRGKPFTCPECNGARLVMTGYYEADYCAYCDGEGEVSDPLPFARREIDREILKTLPFGPPETALTADTRALAHDLGLHT